MRYQVTVRSTRFETVEVEALTPEQAENLALIGEYDCEVEAVNVESEINNVVEI